MSFLFRHRSKYEKPRKKYIILVKTKSHFSYASYVSISAEANSTNFTALISNNGGMNVFIRSPALCKGWLVPLLFRSSWCIFFFSAMQARLSEWLLYPSQRMYLHGKLGWGFVQHLSSGMDWLYLQHSFDSISSIMHLMYDLYDGYSVAFNEFICTFAILWLLKI